MIAGKSDRSAVLKAKTNPKVVANYNILVGTKGGPSMTDMLTPGEAAEAEQAAA